MSNSTHTNNPNITNRLLSSKIRSAITSRLSITLWDRELKGFGARISPKGRVTWLASKAIGRGRGSTQRIVVGHYPGMPLDQARIEAGHTISRLARGEDVASLIKQAKATKVASRQCPTVKEMVTDYLKERANNPNRNAESRYEREVAQLFNCKIVPELGASKRINEISKADIKAMIRRRKDAGHHVAARNLYVQLKPFFDWCTHEELIAVSPCIGVAPLGAAKERQHKLNDDEIKALWSASGDQDLFGSFYRVLLLTAQRRGEVASMQWQEVNFDRAEWIIPALKTKNGREHLVPLSPLVVSILNAQPQRKPSEYVFGRYPGAPMSGFSKAKRELDTEMLTKLREDDPEAMLRHWRIHDLRRTAASGMASLRVEPHVIEAVLNHTPGKLVKTYQVWQYAEERRQALGTWANHLVRQRLIK